MIMMEQNKPCTAQQDTLLDAVATGNAAADTDDGPAGGRSYGSAMIPLGESFEPGDDDVLVGRGKACRNSTGNVRFRELVESRLDDYSAASSKLEKSAIVTSILYEIRTRSPNGGFIKKDPLTGQWYEVGDFVARERVTQSFRDALHGKYRSSNSSKKKRRKEELQKAKKESSAAKKLKSEEGLKMAPTQSACAPPLSGLKMASAQSATLSSQSATLSGPESMVPSASLSSSVLREGLLSGPTVNSLDQQLVNNGLPPEFAAAALSFNQLAAAEATLSPGVTRRESLLQGVARRESLLQGAVTRRGSLLQGLAPQQVMSLEEQLHALQNMGASSAATTSNNVPSGAYPNSWFRVNSSASNLQSLSDPMPTGLTFSPTANAAATATANSSSSAMMASLINRSSSNNNNNNNNNSNITYNFNQGGVSLVDPAAALWQPHLPANAMLGNSSSSGAIDNFGNFFSEDDNPFEPVPIAEEISRRNAQRDGKP